MHCSDAEQTWSRLVVQFVSDLAPLLLLHTDQLAIQPAILIARSAERARKRIEAFGEDAELLDLWQSKPRRITALLKTEHAPGEMGKRIEEAAEHRVENEKDNALRVSHMIASEEKSRQASAISSEGSPMMITGLA